MGLPNHPAPAPWTLLSLCGWLLVGCLTQPDPQSEFVPEIQDGSEVIADLMEATPEGGLVLLPKGHYFLTRPVVIDRSLRFVGEKGTVLELLPSISTSLIEVRPVGSAEAVRGVEIGNLELVGQGGGQTAGDGILILSAQECHIHGITVRSVPGDGIYCSNVSRSLFEEVTLIDCGRNGFSFGEAVSEPMNSDNRIVRSAASRCDLIGFDCEPGFGNTFSDCRADSNGRYGISLGAEGRSARNRVERCRAKANGASGINIWSNENVLVDCVASWNREDGINLIGPICRGNRVTACTTFRNGRHGIGLDRASATRVSRNRVFDNGESGRGNGIELVAGIPVYDNSIIRNTVFGSSHRYALVITELVSRTIVEANDLTGEILIGAPDVIWR